VPGRIPQSFIDDLMARLDIVEVVDEHVPLKKKGREYMACCPFHDEKTPSFSVSPQKQFYHCFGCGAHGTAIGFLMDHLQMSFPEAVEALAERVGLEVPREALAGAPREDHAPLYEVLARARDFYRRQLRSHPGAPRAVEYLRGRGLSGEIAKEFELGFAPPGWDHLVQALGTDEAARAQLARAGLTAEKIAGRPYDRLRDRIVFPIHDRRGRVVGFGGRVIDEGEPKYLNSPETPVFHKGRELYGLHRVRRRSGRPARLLVVEGYMDVVGLAQFGIDDVVATLGTAATADHLEQLFRTAPEVVFCFDGDAAGRRAAWRALETALPVLRGGRQTGFMFLPEGEDPDSLVRSLGAEGFAARVREAATLTEFLFDHLTDQVDMETLDGRARLAELARPLLERLPRGALRELATGRLAELTGMDPVRLTTLSEGEGTRRPARRGASPSVARRGSPSLVRQVVSLLVHHPHLGRLATDRLAIDSAGLRALRLPGIPLLADMLESLAAQPNLTTGALVERFRDHEAGAHLAKLAAREPPLLSEREDLERQLADGLAKLSAMRDRQRLDELARKGLSELSEAERGELSRLRARGADEH